MRLAKRSTLCIGLLLVFLIMSVIPVDKVANLSYLVLEVNSSNFSIVKTGTCGAMSRGA